MKRKPLLLALMAAVLLSASTAWAQDDFYVIAAGPTAVGTKITTVPYTISIPGFYYLTGNLTYNGSSNAITVNANDVTIDLMGFSLTNSGAVGITNGIYMHGCTNVEIRNGTVHGFFGGIFESSNGINHHRISNIRAFNPGSNGLGINIGLSGSQNVVKNCTAANNAGRGIAIGSGTIIGCEAYGNQCGFLVLSGPASIIGNVATNNTGFGFMFFSSQKIMLDQNSASDNGTNYSPKDATNTAWGVNAGG
jgi:parallel beta-helix repeat protein